MPGTMLDSSSLPVGRSIEIASIMRWHLDQLGRLEKSSRKARTFAGGALMVVWTLIRAELKGGMLADCENPWSVFDLG